MERVLGRALLVSMAALAFWALEATTTYAWIEKRCGYDPYSGASAIQGTRVVYCMGYSAPSRVDPICNPNCPRDDVLYKKVFDQNVLGREGDRLQVNGGKLVAPGSSWTVTHWSPQLNPWLILRDKVTITNKGAEPGEDTLLVDGVRLQDWVVSPLGIGLSILALWLMRKG